jgi:hypothetical protein
MNASDYCPPYTLWGVWDGFAIPVAWCGQESKVRATEYQEAVYKSARTTLAQRSPDRSNAYENLLRVRLNDLAARMAKQRRRGRPVVPLDLFDESEIFFWFTALAQLLLLGAVPRNEDDPGNEYTFIELVDNFSKR